MIRQVGDNMISFSTTIISTKLVPVLEVSTLYQEIMSCAGPHHKICTREMSTEIIKKIMDQNTSAPINVEKEKDEKVALVVFQQ